MLSNLRETYAHSTLKTHIDRLQEFTIQTPIPGLPFFNLEHALSSFKVAWYKFVFCGLLYDWEKWTAFGYPVSFPGDEQARAEQMNALQRRLDLSRLQNIEYVGIQKVYDSETATRTNSMDKEIGIVKKQIITVAVNLAQQEMQATFIVGKILSVQYVSVQFCSYPACTPPQPTRDPMLLERDQRPR